MPASYTWFVSASGSGSSAGAGARGGAGRGTGADGRDPYAFTRQMEPDTGDAVFDEARRSWALGSPLAERVLRCLRTQKGAAQRDPTYGLDQSALENARPNAAVAAQQAIRNALQRFVDRGHLAQLVVETDVIAHAGGRAFLFRVSFRDPMGDRFTVSGRPT